MDNTKSLKLRRSKQALLDELTKAGAVVKGKMIKCPFHDDNSPSGSIHQGEDGCWRYTCFTSTCGFHGDVFDVTAKMTGEPIGDVLKAALGIDQRDSDGPARKPKRVFASVDEITNSVRALGRLDAAYQYTNPQTRAVEIVQIRYRDGDGKKHFLTHRAQGTGFVLGAPPKPWPLYNRTRVATAEIVIVVEGEKCVHALAQIGIAATTSLSGSGNADKADWRPLAGKHVIIWPDKDESGTKYAADVVGQLERLTPPAEVHLVNVADLLELAEHGDVADLIAGGWTAQDFWTYVNDSMQPIGPAADLDARIASIQDGTHANLPWPWRQLTIGSQALLPSTITVQCGPPGTSKSLMLLESLLYWNAQGISAVVKMLESTRADHLHRALAILDGNWDMLNPKWCRANPLVLPLARANFKKAIDQLARCLVCDELGKVSYRDILAWIEREAVNGRQIIVVDPITAVATGDNRQVEDHDFIVQAASILRRTGARLVLTTHPRTLSGKTKATMDDMAGGRAFSRHTDCVILIQSHEPPVHYRLKDADGAEQSLRCNRSIKIAKARYGPGSGWRIGFNLGSNVRFVENGIIVGTASEIPEIA